MFKIQVEVNGTNIAVESANTLNMGGLNAFIDSLTKKDEGEWQVMPNSTESKMVFGLGKKAPAKTVKRGRGRPAGAKNKRK